MRYGSFVKTVLSVKMFSLAQLSRYRAYLISIASDFKEKIMAVLIESFQNTRRFLPSRRFESSKSYCWRLCPDRLKNISSETLAQYLAELSRNRIKRKSGPIEGDF